MNRILKKLDHPTLRRTRSMSSAPPKRRKLRNGRRESLAFQNLKNPDELASRSTNEMETDDSATNAEVVEEPKVAPKIPRGRGIALPGLGVGFNPADIKKNLRKNSSAPSSPQSNSQPDVINSPNFGAKFPLKKTSTTPLPDSPVSGKDALLQWLKSSTAGYRDVNVQNFTTSWANGLAFCALIHHFRPHLIQYDSLNKQNVKENLTLAFDTAEKLGVPRLLDPEDVYSLSVPDKNSMMTYLSELYKFFKRG